ncbi:MAG TPA: cysteine--tRNA ligase, partial [Xanthobacteraceae bacterium]|nr:cysteine--tRNA ligase [Xanthobacteraceae bacterium]
HHENEIAQSRCAFHTQVMANYWMHNGFLEVEGKKMAKSEGNFVTIRELLENWRGYSWPGETLRFNMLRTHYRQPIDWTFDALNESHQVLCDWYDAFKGLRSDDRVSADALGSLCDDLNTPGLIAELHKLRKKKEYQSLFNTLKLLGFSGQRERLKRTAFVTVHMGVETNSALSVTPLRASDVEKLVADREVARKTKNFKEADRIRDELAKMGVVLKDSKDGTTWEIAR